MGLLALRRDDVLLASFLRSGNTWVRLFLCNLVSLSEWGGRRVTYGLLEATMPRLGHDNLFRAWSHSSVPRVVKTHRPYSRLFGRTRSIGIVRDPRDVMVSSFHFMRDRKDSFRGEFGEFIRHPRFGLEAWFRHHASWRDHWQLVLSYEALVVDPEREFGRLAVALRLECPPETVREAIARSSFESMRTAEHIEAPAQRDDSLFFRSGSRNQWGSYFSRADLRLYSDLCDRFEVRFGQSGQR